MKRQVNFRIVVEEPLAGVTYAVQRGRSDLLAPSRSTHSERAFEFSLTLADLDADPPRLTGECAQGPAKQRFVYVNSGYMAGQKNSCWARRAKVPLYSIRQAVLVSCPTSNCHMYALPCEVSLLPEIPRWAWVDRRRSWS
jgi:hypothetical protein